MIAAANPYKTDEELYLSVERLLDKTVWSFVRRYGGEFDELRADANLHYIQASYKYDDSRGVSYSSHIRFCVWNGLLDAHRIKAHRLAKTGCILGSERLHDLSDLGHNNWKLQDFVEELS